MSKKLKKVIAENRLVVFIFLCAFFLRTIFLNKYPIGITHDELNYIIAAKSLFFTGKFAPGTASAILPSGLENLTVVIAEVPSIILATLIGWAKSSLFISRIVGASLSSLSAVLLYYLVLQLLNDRKLATIAAFVMAINPWSILMGRTIFEVNFFVFFFLAGFLVLLKTKGQKMFYSLPLYLLGFFSYTGGQVSFYLYVVITLVFKFLDGKRKEKKTLLQYFLIMTFVLIAYVGIVFRNQSFESRGGELFLPTSQEVSSLVDKERKLAVPSRYNSIFINKATVYIKGFSEKYLNAFSVDDLFLNGEFRAAFSYQKHGTFYLIDFALILFGFALLYKKHKNACLLLISLILVSIVTSGISTIEFSYSQRAGMMYPFLIIFVGAGFMEIIKGIAKLRFRSLFTIGFVLLYLLFFLNLIHIYFYRFPVYASEGWFYQDRLLSRYIILTNQFYPEKEIVVHTFEPKIVFQEYLFYSGNYDESEDVIKVNKNMSENKYVFGSVEFTSTCVDKNLEDGVIRIFDGTLNCREQEDDSVLRITRYRDTFANYQIENDVLCNDIELGRYVHPVSYLNFEVEGMTGSDYCRSWITKL